MALQDVSDNVTVNGEKEGIRWGTAILSPVLGTVNATICNLGTGWIELQLGFDDGYVYRSTNALGHNGTPVSFPATSEYVGSTARVYKGVSSLAEITDASEGIVEFRGYQVEKPWSGNVPFRTEKYDGRNVTSDEEFWKQTGSSGLLVFEQSSYYGVIQFVEAPERQLKINFWVGDIGITDFSGFSEGQPMPYDIQLNARRTWGNRWTRLQRSTGPSGFQEVMTNQRDALVQSLGTATEADAVIDHLTNILQQLSACYTGDSSVLNVLYQDITKKKINYGKYPEEFVFDTVLAQVTADLYTVQKTFTQRLYGHEGPTILSHADRIGQHALLPALKAGYVDPNTVILTHFQRRLEARTIPYYDALLLSIRIQTGPLNRGAALDYLAIPHELGH
ncbi:MAG: hypothetical protein AAF485_24380, partial [Chloroflexota bacterium]